jgi:TolB protein
LTAEIWYRLLNCGFHLPAAAGTDAMANFASLRGPIGLNRVYVNLPAGPLNIDLWLDSLKRGHSFASNGPLLGFTLGSRQPGDELRLPAGENKVKFTAWLRSMVPLDHLQVVCNGDVVSDLKLKSDRDSADVEDRIPISRSGWCLLRAWSAKAEHPVLDNYAYATTSPVYVKVTGSNSKAEKDAAYFVAWIDRLIKDLQANQDWNTEAERNGVFNLLSYARTIYTQIGK